MLDIIHCVGCGDPTWFSWDHNDTNYSFHHDEKNESELLLTLIIVGYVSENTYVVDENRRSLPAVFAVCTDECKHTQKAADALYEVLTCNRHVVYESRAINSMISYYDMYDDTDKKGLEWYLNKDYRHQCHINEYSVPDILALVDYRLHPTIRN